MADSKYKMNCPHCKKKLTPEQVASLLGSTTSKAKKISSANNGKLGGRPKKSKKIRQEKNCLSISPNVLRLGGRFNAAKPLLYEVPTYLR